MTGLNERRDAIERVVREVLIHDRFANNEDQADAMVAAIINDLPDRGYVVTKLTSA